MKKSIILIPVITLLIVAGGVLAVHTALSNRLSVNDQNLAGNTGGNLLNQGLFCEADGKVYFSNSFDSGYLYSMNSDETELKRLNEARVFSLNTGGGYLYYCIDTSTSGGTGLGYIMPMTGLFRVKTNGSSVLRMQGSPALTATLCGNHLYYLRYDTQAVQLYKIQTDGEEDLAVLDYVINPSSYDNGIIYFSGTQDDHYLYALDTATESVSTLLEENTYNAVYADGYIYYMDLGNNYRLCRYSLSGRQIEVLTEDRVDGYNVGSGLIFYQKNADTDPALIRMNADGSNPEIIAAGNYSNINLTSQYAYYQKFGDEAVLYHTPLYGAPSSIPFSAALQASLAK